MSCYFIVNTYITDNAKRSTYDEYIELVKPLVESFGGEYLIRTEKIETLTDQWKPDRIIVIRFPDRESLDRCFESEKYQMIKSLRINSVDSRAIIVEGVENESYKQSASD